MPRNAASAPTYPHAASTRVGDSTHDRETEPGPRSFGHLVLGQPRVGLEDALALRLGYAGPIVLHGDLHVLATSRGADPYDLARIAVLERVVHEVHERLPDESAVAPDGEPALPDHRYRLPCIVDGEPNGFDDIVEQLIHLDRPQRRCEIERARAREQQHVVHETNEPPSLPYDRAGE